MESATPPSQSHPASPRFLGPPIYAQIVCTQRGHIWYVSTLLLLLILLLLLLKECYYSVVK